jgi:hypothetical protein
MKLFVLFDNYSVLFVLTIDRQANGSEFLLYYRYLPEFILAILVGLDQLALCLELSLQLMFHNLLLIQLHIGFTSPHCSEVPTTQSPFSPLRL